MVFSTLMTSSTRLSDCYNRATQKEQQLPTHDKLDSISHSINGFMFCITSQLCFTRVEKKTIIYNNIPSAWTSCISPLKLTAASCLTTHCARPETSIIHHICSLGGSFPSKAGSWSHIRPQSEHSPVVCQAKRKQPEGESLFRHGITPERWLIWWSVPSSGWQI